jgi:hypothetical protein
VEGCARRIVAIVPVDPVFALLKSARVSTAGTIRARYHGSTRRVLFKASSVNLSQDARALRVKEKVIAIVSLRQSTNGGERGIRHRRHANCTCCCAFQTTRDITSGMGTYFPAVGIHHLATHEVAAVIAS